MLENLKSMMQTRLQPVLQAVQPQNPMQPVTVYRLRDDAAFDPLQAFKLLLYLNHVSLNHNKFILPDFPCITVRQYQALPVEFREWFEATDFQPQRKQRS